MESKVLIPHIKKSQFFQANIFKVFFQLLCFRMFCHLFNVPVIGKNRWGKPIAYGGCRRTSHLKILFFIKVVFQIMLLQNKSFSVYQSSSIHFNTLFNQYTFWEEKHLQWWAYHVPITCNGRPISYSHRAKASTRGI